jgi:hypothetical protein
LRSASPTASMSRRYLSAQPRAPHATRRAAETRAAREHCPRGVPASGVGVRRASAATSGFRGDASAQATRRSPARRAERGVSARERPGGQGPPTQGPQRCRAPVARGPLDRGQHEQVGDLSGRHVSGL